jgi:hypothetical protein
VATDAKLSVAGHELEQGARAGLIAAVSAVGLTAGSAGISSLGAAARGARGHS